MATNEMLPKYLLSDCVAKVMGHIGVGLICTQAYKTTIPRKIMCELYDFNILGTAFMALVWHSGWLCITSLTYWCGTGRTLADTNVQMTMIFK